jgi:hypothetical protein
MGTNEPTLMTSAELTAAIASGAFKVTRLPARRPNPRHLVMTRVGGSRSAVAGIHPDATLIQGTEAWGKRGTKQSRRRLA